VAGVFFAVAAFVAGTPRAAFLDTREFEGGALETVFFGLAAACFARALLEAAPEAAGEPGFLAEADCRVAFLAAPALVTDDFATGDFAAVLPVRAFAARTGASGGRETLTNPRIARTVLRADTAAFAAGRFFALLRGVEAMGTTLGTVETWMNRPVTGLHETRRRRHRPTVDTGE
jgi:hypothetical protein